MLRSVICLTHRVKKVISVADETRSLPELDGLNSLDAKESFQLEMHLGRKSERSVFCA